MTDASPPGYHSLVHSGPLRPILIWYAPFRAVLFNMLILMWMWLMLTWRWAVLATVIHAGLALLWHYDPYLLASVWEARKFRRFLGSD